mmetsp:Transcript_47742/g.94892  ORF Transcript_47742/g.94892 Transcript_47742/m.94892 type:complete len:112 (-) Transcript_47742:18-353(-)
MWIHGAVVFLSLWCMSSSEGDNIDNVDTPLRYMVGSVLVYFIWDGGTIHGLPLVYVLPESSSSGLRCGFALPRDRCEERLAEHAVLLSSLAYSRLWFRTRHHSPSDRHQNI